MRRLGAAMCLALVASVGCVETNPRFDEVAVLTEGDTGSESSETMDPTTTLTESDSGSESESESGSETGDPCAASNWWNPQWSARRRVRFDNSGQGPLEEFTVRVVLPDGFDYELTDASGADLRFVDDDGQTLLSHYVQQWNPDGESTLWVRVPEIDGTRDDDHVWLYYGAPEAPSVEDPAGSFDLDYAAVVHLDEPSGIHMETIFGFDCAWNGAGEGTQDAVGYIAGANRFRGDGVVCTPDSIPVADAYTLTAWVNLPLMGDSDQAVITVESLDAPFSGPGLYVERATGGLGDWRSNGYEYGETAIVSADAWHFVALRTQIDGGAGIISTSVDGGPTEEVFVGNTSNQALEPGSSLTIGAWLGGGPNSNARGRIDEVTISTVDRGEQWVRAQYQSSSGQFASVEALESCD